MHGAFIVHKPEGITSSDCVTKIKWALVNNGYTTKKIRIGHGGTLDPFATGVLVVLFGEATKLADTYLHSRKAYSGIITLGVQTSTADLTGEKICEKPVPSLSESEWNKLAERFVSGEYLQTPPMYSAKKKDGVALYEHARAGVSIERVAILKKIYRYELKLVSATELSFEVECESGTYVRTLAEDLAASAGTVAHLKTLCRTRSSDMKLEESVSLEKLLKSIEEKKELKSLPNFKPFAQVASHISKLEIDENSAAQIRQGKTSEIQKICPKADTNFPKEKYVVATLRSTSGARSEEPVALLSRTYPAPFRLQCVFNEGLNG